VVRIGAGGGTDRGRGWYQDLPIVLREGAALHKGLVLHKGLFFEGLLVVFLKPFLKDYFFVFSATKGTILVLNLFFACLCMFC
jgi:hypothetical protein